MDEKRRCPAMIEEGIEDPDSEEGCLFCAGDRYGQIESKCPYPFCVVFEQTLALAEIKDYAKRLHTHGVSVKDIALILGRHVTTIKSYLRK